jgi:uncharacterized protein (TIGR03437 family)
MRHSILVLLLAALPAVAAESDALAIDANLRALHMPYGTILDPVYDSIGGNTIVGYSRCGDSALWTGAYLAAEAFRYNVTRAPEALANVKAAVAGLQSLLDVTGNNRLARCIFPASWQFAAGIESEEASNSPQQAPPWVWVDNTSRDQIVGVYFGLAVAFDLVDDAGVQSAISNMATLWSAFIAGHQWSPNDDITSTFVLRPEELQMLLQVTRHVNPKDTISGPFFVPPVETGVLVDVQSNDSYFKFNLDYMSLYNLIRYQDNSDNRGAYSTVRKYTSTHQNAFFNMIDRALNGPDATRDAETRSLLDQWLQRPVRDEYVTLTGYPVCGSEACQPVPVPVRPPTDFLWQRDPFLLAGGGYGTTERAGIDYLLPYWMGRYYGVIQESTVQSAAAPSGAISPGSIASLYGTNLASGTGQATSQPLPTTLSGTTLSIKDSSGATLAAPLLYVSPTQINFVVPDTTATGTASFVPSGGQAASASVQSVAPAFFSADGTGTGVAAATAIRTQAANPALQSAIPVYQCGSGGCTAVPMSLGVDTPIYVTFYGTGIRNRSSLNNVTVTINGISVPVTYAGPTPGFTGLDQINAGLVLSLRGAGVINVAATVDGAKSNTVTIAVQ